MRIPAFLLSLLLLGVSTLAQAWWNEDWTARKKITLTNPAGAVSEVPVLIRLHTGNFDFLAANENGSDLRLVAGDDATELKFHIEKWDSLNQLALLWVKLPQLAAKTELYLYFGNEAATMASNSKATYDNASVVYHFAEADGNPVDSGANALNATAFSGRRIAASFANGGIALEGDQTLGLPAVAANNGYSLAMWVKPAALDGQLLQLGDMVIALEAGTLKLQSAAVNVAATTPLQAGKWQHVALTASDALRIYVNGKLVGEAPAGALPAAAVTLGPGYRGELDELQIAGVARDANWMAVQASMGPDGALVSMGEDEASEGGGQASYFGIILQSVTLDGWVVIGILAVMFAVAVWVMISKAGYINRVDKSNNRFMDKFRELSTDLAMIDKAKGLADEFRHSSLYRIYHIGALELKHRFKDTDAAHTDKTLSPQSLDSIRASLDAGLVKETHRLNKLMVLLTIAISGGPFLGLLGTVVGVMITFAAIAATGDVNINSIAPGIAAALVATIAGLAVAIPALFGYNYLGSRIKTISSDMHIFVDEYITKLAENYSR